MFQAVLLRTGHGGAGRDMGPHLEAVAAFQVSDGGGPRGHGDQGSSWTGNTALSTEGSQNISPGEGEDQLT